MTTWIEPEAWLTVRARASLARGLDAVDTGAAITVPVGRVSDAAATLLQVTRDSLEQGIAQVRNPANTSRRSGV